MFRNPKLGFFIVLHRIWNLLRTQDFITALKYLQKMRKVSYLGFAFPPMKLTEN